MENECIVKNQTPKEDTSLDVEVLISKSEWLSLCKKYDKWCNFETVMNHTYEEVEDFIKNMRCWEPM